MKACSSRKDNREPFLTSEIDAYDEGLVEIGLKVKYYR